MARRGTGEGLADEQIPIGTATGRMAGGVRVRILMAMVAVGLLLVVGACEAEGDGEGEDAVAADETEDGTDADDDSDEADDADDDADPGEPQEGGSISIATSAQVPSLDPHLEGSTVRQDVSFLMYETLVTMDENLEPQPELAESWEQIDDTTFEFTLREGVVFHNGEEMDAEDVKYSYERLIDPEVGSAGAGDLVYLNEIEVVDPLTVRFHLDSPSASFLAAIGGKYSAVIPKDYVQEGDELRSDAVGTGPFMLEEWEPDQRLVLTKNPDYWEDGLPYLDQVSFEVIPDETRTMSELRTGGVDMAALESPQNFLQLEGEEGLVTETTEGLAQITLEMQMADEPTDDVLVRQAIQLSLDREAIVEAATRGLGDPIGGAPPALGPYAADMADLPNQERDVDRARELLAEAGHEDGVEFTLRTITGFQAYADAAEVIESNVAEAGLQANIEPVDIGIWIEDWVDNRTTPTMNNAGGGTDPDLLWFRHFHSRPDGADFRNWENDEADELLQRGRQTFDEDERVEIYHEFQALIAEDVPSIPLYSPYELIVRREEVKNYVQHPTGYYTGFRETWLDEG